MSYWSRHNAFEPLVGRPQQEAYYDGLYGLVPCVVLEVTELTVKAQVDWGGCAHPLQVGPSPYGAVTTIEEFPHRDIVPTRAVVPPQPDRGIWTAHIVPYRWETTP